MSDDVAWLRQYAEEGSEPAFRELVARHIQLVNATARRMTSGDAHLAQDVTQLVFTDLARKAKSLPPDVVLGGWLHRHTCYTALKAIRAESRRRARERTAMEIHAQNDNAGQDAYWAQLAPLLDAALNRLDASDRDAIVLRYLQQQDVRSVGLALGTSENAAQKRLGRALEKLRGILVRSGVTVASASALGTTLNASALAPVPAGLAASVATSALSGAAAAGVTTFTLASIKTMITSKLALSLAAGAAAAAAITTVLVTQRAPAPAAVPAPVIAKVSSPIAKAPAIQIAANQIEPPKAPPAPAHDADPAAAAPTPTIPDPSAQTQMVFSQALANLRDNLISSGGDGNVRTGVVVTGPGIVTVSTGNKQTMGAAFPLGAGNDQVMLSIGGHVIPTGSGEMPQIADNGDGTMTITLPNGTTQIVPKPPVPTNVTDNGDGTVTLTMSDGSSQRISNDAGSNSSLTISNGTSSCTSSASSLGGGTMVISTSTAAQLPTDNSGASTMTIALPDGTTQTVTTPPGPANIIVKGDDSARVIMSDGSTPPTPPSGNTGSASVVIQSSP